MKLCDNFEFLSPMAVFFHSNIDLNKRDICESSSNLFLPEKCFCRESPKIVSDNAGSFPKFWRICFSQFRNIEGTPPHGLVFS